MFKKINIEQVSNGFILVYSESNENIEALVFTTPKELLIHIKNILIKEDTINKQKIKRKIEEQEDEDGIII